MRPHVLFVIGPALGHVGRSLRIIEHLRPHAHVSVGAIRDGSWLGLLGDDVTVLSNTSSDDDLAGTTVEEFVTASAPDVVCLDQNAMTFALTRVDPSIPTVFVTNGFLTSLWGSTTVQDLKLGASFDMNERRLDRGLVPLVSARTLYAADDIVAADPVGLLPPGLNPPFHAVGPITWEPQGASPPALESSRPRLAASFGSSGREFPRTEDIDRLRRLLECDFTAWVGGRPEAFTSPTDLGFDNTPFSVACRSAPLAITQGGAGSTYIALRSGVPVAVRPTHRNHALLGEILADAGIGCLLDQLVSLDDQELQRSVAEMQHRLRSFPITKSDIDPAEEAAKIILRRAEVGPEVHQPPAIASVEDIRRLDCLRDSSVPEVLVRDLGVLKAPIAPVRIRRVQPTGGGLVVERADPRDENIDVPGYRRRKTVRTYRRRFAWLPAPLRSIAAVLAPSSVKSVALTLEAVPPDRDLLEAANPTRQLFLHVGTHKTGTTALQSYAVDNFQELRALGLVYLTDEELGARNMPSLPLLAIRPELDMSIRRRFAFASLEEARADLTRKTTARLAGRAPKILVSHEALSFARTVEEVERLLPLVGDREVTVLVVLREKSSFLDSYRRQVAKLETARSHVHPRLAPNYRTSVMYVADDTWVLDVDRMLAAYRLVFGDANVITIDYEDAMARNGSVVPSLLEVCGIDLDRLPSGWDRQENVTHQ